MAIAEDGIEKLYEAVDTLITIPNQNLFRVATEQTTMSDAFAMADEVLHSGVRGITDLMVVPGLINLDFADVRTIMDEMGKAMMGTGEATGDRRAVEAAESAISNPLLDDVSLKGAKGVLINITGGKDLTLYEVDEAASLIRSQVDSDANIIVGSSLDDDLDGIVRVSVVATGVQAEEMINAQPRSRIARPVIPAAKPISPVLKDGLKEVSIEEKISPAARAAELPPVYVQMQEPEIEPEPVPAPVAQVPLPTGNSEPVAYIDDFEPEYPADIPEPAPSRSQTVVKRPFGFFGRKKSIPVSNQPPQPRKMNTGDLFDDAIDEEMEIPSFLRRQNR